MERDRHDAHQRRTRADAGAGAPRCGCRSYGSTGILYFYHEWNPAFREARLLEDDAMRVAVAEVNARIQRLAPVLNSETGNHHQR